MRFAQLDLIKGLNSAVRWISESVLEWQVAIAGMAGGFLHQTYRHPDTRGVAHT